MNLHALRWLVRDTVRQARASGILAVVVGVTAGCVAVCLTASVVSGETPELTLLLGTVRVPLSGGVGQGVRTVQAVLAVWVADSAGLLLALAWTAAFMPAFLEPASVAVLVAKPVPRWLLFVGKFFGVVCFVAASALLFVGTTWLALAVRTGVWDATYFWCVPLLVLHFTIFYSFSALLAVSTRSAIACLFGSALFWLVCWGTNFGRHAVLAVPELQAMGPGLSHTAEVAYWLLPKPTDPGILLLEALGIGDPFPGVLDFNEVRARGAFHPVLSVLSSLLFAAVLVAVSAYEFATADY
jgi:hypothetical protein